VSSTVDLPTVAVSVVTSAFGVGVAFYIKDYLERRSAFRRLRDRLERIAGKNATVIYENPQASQIAPKAMLYRIKEFDADGVTLENDLHTVFVPIQGVLEEDLILPSANYEEKLHALEKEEMKRFFDNVFPDMIKKILDTVKNEITSQGTEIHAVIGVQVERALEEKGFEIRKLPAGSASPPVTKP
jgi:hypothetical protein